MNYKEYLHSEEWKRIKGMKESKKEKSCAFCGATKFIELHHLFYRKDLKDTKLGDLRWLCCRCHDATHFLIKKGLIQSDGQNSVKTFYQQRRAVLKKIRVRLNKGGKFGDPKTYKHNKIKPRSEKKITKKEVCRKIELSASKEGRKADLGLFRRDSAALKYVRRAGDDFIFTKRTISELSPWNMKMIKTLTNKNVKDISDGLSIILKDGTSAAKIKQAFQLSIIYNRLASLKY